MSKAKIPSLDELWRSSPPAERTFEPGRIAGLPETARRYLEHAIAPGTKLASEGEFFRCKIDHAEFR